MSYTILVPLDDSRWSRSATELAIDIARRAKDPVQLTGLHVINVTHIKGRLLEDIAGLLGFEPVVVPEKVEAHYRSLGQELLDRFAERCQQAGVPVQTQLDQGAVVERVVHHGDRHDLVVLGVRGETEERFPGQGGSTAERILKRIASTTLVVGESQPPIERIALGYDGSEGASRALRAVIHLAELIGAEVRVLHVTESVPSPDPLDEARRLLQDQGIVADITRVSGEPQEALPAEALRLNCDTLAIGYRGRALLKDVFLGRTTEWLVGNTPLALLVAR